MGHNVGDASPFLKRVLIPFWCVRIFVMAINVVVYVLAISVVAQYKDDISHFETEFGTNLAPNAIIAIWVVIMVIIALCLILDLVAIIKRARRNLSPKFFLIINVVQTFVWTVLFALLSFVGLLIYASVIFHKHRKGTLEYAPAANPANPATGYNPHVVQPGVGYAPNAGYAPNNQYAQGHYAPQDYNKPSQYEYGAQAYGQRSEAHEMGNQPRYS
ncbi:hypothetical protein ACHAQA_004292 [Verticillium albo-atrum]